jgi:DICT domain-containing protein
MQLQLQATIVTIEGIPSPVHRSRGIQVMTARETTLQAVQLCTAQRFVPWVSLHIVIEACHKRDGHLIVNFPQAAQDALCASSPEGLRQTIDLKKKIF